MEDARNGRNDEQASLKVLSTSLMTCEVQDSLRQREIQQKGDRSVQSDAK